MLSLALALLPAFVAAESVITAAPVVPTDLAKREIGYGATTTYETTSPLPLTDYYYAYTDIPYKVNPYPVGRGPQSGYNQCNATTEGPDSQCQTAIVNDIFDFCFWGAPGLVDNQTVGEVEAAVVAYCTKSGHGSRIFPEGTFSAVQFMRTPAYIQVTGRYNRSAIGFTPTDSGGELDPHGADFFGNPLGGLMYSKSLPSGNNETYQQTQSWNNFLDGGKFCIKLCDPNWTQTDNNYCQNIYDIIGCDYNMPAAYEEDTFLSCEGDIQDEVGTYTSDGQTYTWHQPTLLPATSTLPWTPRIPASSNCVTYKSSDLFPPQSLGYQSVVAVASSSTTASASASNSMMSMGSSSGRAKTMTAASTGSGVGSGTAASATASSTKKSGAGMLKAPMTIVGAVGVVLVAALV